MKGWELKWKIQFYIIYILNGKVVLKEWKQIDNLKYISCTKNWNIWWYNFLHRWLSSSGEIICTNANISMARYVYKKADMKKSAATESVTISVISQSRKIINLSKFHHESGT